MRDPLLVPTAGPGVRAKLYADLYATHGQGDAMLTNRLVDDVVASIHPQIAPALVLDFVSWVVAFDRIPAGKRDVTRDDIITRAKQALGLPRGYEVQAGASNAHGGGIADPCGRVVQDAYDRAGVTELVNYTRGIVGQDDPDPDSMGGYIRRITGLSELISGASMAFAYANDLPDY